MPLKVCLEPACAEPAWYRGRCVKHSQQRERSIDRAGAKVYRSKKWAMTRKRKLFDTPLCERCGEMADTVHHRVDLDDGGAPYSLANLEAVCASCHSKETRARQLV
jgi:5-methylcytosine-specific restriction endonuclease McrA